jgi:hypothetical protein
VSPRVSAGRRAPLAACVLSALLITLTVAPPTSAARAATKGTLPIAPFPVIHSPIVSDYLTYQLKFTYLGPQLKTVTSLALVGQGRAYDADAFIAFERALDYSNDLSTGDTLTLAPGDIKAFVDAIALRAGLTDTTLIPAPNVSLMIMRGSGPGAPCWEHLAVRPETDVLYQLLRESVTNPADTLTVSNFRRQMAGVRR